MTPREPPYPYGYRLALLRCWGEEERAQNLLDALNQFQRAFDHPDYAMPAPLKTSEQLTETIGDPFLKARRAA
jgi:hypothetical protein